MHELDIWVESFHVHSPNNNLNLLSVTGMSGAHLGSSKQGVRDVDIVLHVETDSLKELDDKKHEIYDMFYSNEPFTITRDFKDLRLFMIQEGSYDIDNITCSDGKFPINLKMIDPYLYGPEETLKLEDISIVENKGTAEADPIFELTAKKKTTFAMVSNGDDEDAEYNLIGVPADVDEEVVNEKELLFTERGDTIDDWTESGAQVDGGTVDGRLSTDNDGITVPDYGNGDKWHGPALIKEISPIKDFEVEMMLRARTKKPNETYRIEFYLFDENMNPLGKMAILDKKTGDFNVAAEGRFGGDVGYANYPINRSNYEHRWEKYYGMLRMRRRGDKFEFYTARITSDNKHIRRLENTYIDIDKEYSGKLKYVQIHIGKYGESRSASAPKIQHIKVSSFADVAVDQTPYILDEGDVVIFDHKDEDILINGEPRNDLKNFGGSFFTLEKGENQIIITPEDSFDSKVTYRDKYL